MKNKKAKEVTWPVYEFSPQEVEASSRRQKGLYLFACLALKPAAAVTKLSTLHIAICGAITPWRLQKISFPLRNSAGKGERREAAAVTFSVDCSRNNP